MTRKQKLVQEYLPPVFLKQLLRLNERMRFSGFTGKEILSENKNLNATGKGKRAFLLATGPSIKMEDLSVLASEDCFSLSNFFLHNQIKTIRPKFHFFAPYHEPLIQNNFVDWLKDADQMLPSETQMFLGYSDMKLIKSENLFKERKVHYLQFSNTPYFTTKVDLTRPVLNPITGPLMIIPVLIYMGYTEIYLLGCDHTVMRDYKKDINHFYSPEKDKRKNASDHNSWDGIVSSLEYTLKIFEQYSFYQKMIASGQTRIINLSQDTWLDFFELNSLKNVMHDKVY